MAENIVILKRKDGSDEPEYTVGPMNPFEAQQHLQSESLLAAARGDIVLVTIETVPEPEPEPEPKPEVDEDA